MNYEQKQIRITRYLTLIFFIVAVIMAVNGMKFVREFLPAIHSSHIAFLDDNAFIIILVLGYCCAASLIAMLFIMYQFLKRIETGLLFTEENIRALKNICTCCISGCVLTLLLGVSYSKWLLLIAAASGFMSLIVRIIQHSFARALAMKDELDLTI
ncbi:MAG: DUF2975 domain-containing protein [Erysipelotrichia bacterium]|nr:DUF2975 domain-containing protein [Erysipelotrichia bacterium]